MPVTNQKPKAQLTEAKRIAIVRLSALGDVVNTLPALTALRRARPDAHIAWVCEAASAGLLEDHPLLDELIVADRKAWAASLKRPHTLPRTAGEMREVFGRLRRGAFDAAIDFQGNLRSGIITFFTRAPLRVGLARQHGKEPSHLFANCRVELPEGPLHRVERGLHILGALGIETAEAEPVVPATEADRRRIDGVLAERGLERGRFAAIHFGTSKFGSYKKWPADRWAAVAARLAGELDLRAVLTHGPGESDEAEAIARQAGGASALVAPLLSLRELGELFRRCRIFLSVDTGPMHLASAVGAPVVALFGPKDPRVYGPYFGPKAIVEKPLQCRPCRKRSCGDPKCMLAISAEDVLEAARNLMQSEPRRALPRG